MKTQNKASAFRPVLLSFIFLIGLLFMASCSKDNSSTPISVDPDTTDQDTDQIATSSDQTIMGSLTSSFNSETYPTIIFVPAVYETNKELPVIYLTDGIYLYERLLSKVKELGLEAIIVAVGDKADAERQRDYLPSFCGGGFDDDHINFYNFITQDVIPYIDARYENEHSLRSLIGYSFGGVFSSGALFMEDPEAVIFHRFLTIDPNFSCESSGFETQISTMNENIISLGIDVNFKLFRSRSSDLEITWFNGLMEDTALELSWLVFANEDFLNEDHVSVLEPSFLEGLRFIYDL